MYAYEVPKWLFVKKVFLLFRPDNIQNNSGTMSVFSIAGKVSDYVIINTMYGSHEVHMIPCETVYGSIRFHAFVLIT